jgi:hypothetical protein
MGKIVDTKEVSFKKGNSEWHVVISEATALIGMRRSVARSAAQVIQDVDPASAVLRKITHPDLVAAVVEAGGFEAWPVPYDEFAALPDRFVMEWETAVYELNPHWLPGPDDDEESKKVVTGATSE